MRALLVAMAVLAATGCAAEPPERELVVLGAASLTDVLAELADAYEAAHPGTTVVLSTGASSALAQQVVAGAPADVLVTASPATMAVASGAGETAAEPVVLARNVLQLAVPAGNPGGVTGMADLARAELDVALCAVQVPCGAAAQQALQAAGVVAAPDTLEQDVRAVLARLRLGEVDAGLVWATDVQAAAGEVEGIVLPAEVGTDYPVAVLRGGDQPEAAREFVALLLSEQGQAVLAAAGFAPPA